MEGRGRTESEVLLNLLIRSLKDGCRELIEVAAEDTLAGPSPRVGESDTARSIGRLVREDSKTFAGKADTLSFGEGPDTMPSLAPVTLPTPALSGADKDGLCR